MSAPVAVTLARAWIGTPYLHQAALRGAGCDCLGLIRGLWREIRGAEPAPLPAYTPDWDEMAGEDRLLAAARSLLQEKPAAAAAPGDLLVFRMRAGAVAKHLGMQSVIGPDAAFIHAHAGAGVVESRLSSPWARRITARFTLFEE